MCDTSASLIALKASEAASATTDGSTVTLFLIFLDGTRRFALPKGFTGGGVVEKQKVQICLRPRAAAAAGPLAPSPSAQSVSSDGELTLLSCSLSSVFLLLLLLLGSLQAP